MVTATGSKTKPTKTVKRMYLLQVQVRNLLARTTTLRQETLRKIDLALTRQYLQRIGVYGLDGTGHCHVGLELTINWQLFRLHVAVMGKTVRIDRTVYSPDDLSPEVQNAVVVFNQACNAECLQTVVRTTYVNGADTERLNRELGFVNAAPLKWAGTVEQETARVEELPELTVTFRQAIPDEPLPKTDAGKDKDLFDRIKDAFDSGTLS